MSLDYAPSIDDASRPETSSGLPAAARDDRAPGVVLFAGSAGAIAALQRVFADLPADLPAAFVVVQHRSNKYPSMLPQIIQRRTKVPTKIAEDCEIVRRGTIYVAPPDRHLSITGDHRFHLTEDPRICGVLSSANPLFESAAAAYGARTIGIVLSGYDHDGTDGVRALAAVGGRVVAQDVATAPVAGMPRSAIETGCVNAVLSAEAMAAWIGEQTQEWNGSI